MTQLRVNNEGVQQAGEKWLDWVTPLPKEARLTGIAVTLVERICLAVAAESPELIHCAAAELQAALKQVSGADVPVTDEPGPAQFAITLQWGGLVTDPLADLPNGDQAYLIAPTVDDDGEVNGLLLAARSAVGVYYAAKTLQQLLRAPLASSSDGLQVPLFEITDWPDLEERGLWGGSIVDDMDWLADRKMNVLEVACDLQIDGRGRGRTSVAPDVLTRARRRAIKFVPFITHPKAYGEATIFPHYPYLRSQQMPRATCFSRPETRELYTDWLASLGSLEGVSEVSAWLTEQTVRCGCEECSRVNWFVLQTRVIVAAWREAKQRCGDFALRILLTQGSEPDNDLVLAEIPEGVKVSYYSSSGTYHSARRAMIGPVLREYAASGRWLGVYPQVTATYRLVAPFSGAHFIRSRITEFARAGLRNVSGYAVPSNVYHRFNLEAMGEYAWNWRGRDEHEFARCWAVRQGLADPEKVAQWSDVLGPVAWDVYGSGFFISTCSWELAEALVSGEEFELGGRIFGEFHKPEQFDADLAVCQQAEQLAEQIGDEAIIQETRVITGYLTMMKSVHQLSQLIAGEQGVAPDDRAAAAQAFADFAAGVELTGDALVRWERTIPDDGTERPAQRFEDTRLALPELARQMQELAAKLSVAD